MDRQDEKTQNTQKHKTLPKEENLHYSKYLRYETCKRKVTPQRKAQGNKKYTILSNIKKQQKALPREEKQLQNGLNWNTKPNQKIFKIKITLSRGQIQKNKTRQYLTGREFKAVSQGLGTRRDDEILRRRRQGKTKTLYT